MEERFQSWISQPKKPNQLLHEYVSQFLLQFHAFSLTKLWWFVLGDSWWADLFLLALSPSPDMVTAKSVSRTTDCFTTVSREVLRLVLGVTGGLRGIGTRELIPLDCNLELLDLDKICLPI